MSRTIYSTAGSYTFTPPDPSIEVVWADIWGGGSGGYAWGSQGDRGNSGGGGGAGEFVERKMIPIVGGTLAVVVGAGGTGGIHDVSPGDGGQSSVGSVIALGGRHGFLPTISSYPGAWGGGPGGGVTLGGLPSASVRGVREGPSATGGNSGGGGGNRASSNATQPKDAPGASFSALSPPGAGGAGSSSQWGPGGTGGSDAVSPAFNGTAAPASSNGAGGGGGAARDTPGGVGATGADGKAILYYLVIT